MISCCPNISFAKLLNDAIFVIDPQRDRILEANPQGEKC
jgi:hypothetical protein